MNYTDRYLRQIASYSTVDVMLADVANRILRLKPALRLEWRGQDGQNETEQPDHSASSGDSITSSTQITFSVHTIPRPSPASMPNRIFRYTQVWDSTTLTKKMPSECLQSSVGPQRPADQRLSRSTVAAGDATICTSTSDSVTGNEQLCPRQTNAAPSVAA